MKTEALAVLDSERQYRSGLANLPKKRFANELAKGIEAMKN